MKKTTALSLLYGLFLAVTLAIFIGFLHQGQWLQTDLRTLLPEDQGWRQVQIEADKRQEQQLNRQLIALVGHASSEKAFELAENMAKTWQASGYFSQVDAKIQPNLTALRQEIQQLSFATLPKAIRQQLLQKPSDYFQHYAEQLANPFGQSNLLPLEQDWLGLGRFVINSEQPGKLQWNAENGMLFIVDKDITWVLLRGKLTAQEWLNPSVELPALLTQNRHILSAEKGKMLVAGTALFAIDAKQKAESESTLMSSLGISLTLLLLLVMFRSLKILWLFLPIAVGMLVGVTATLLVFEHIHILTIVIGTSLVGVLIDFPLHWFAGTLFQVNWQGKIAIAKLRFTFMLSLLVTLLGYGLLAFTDLPVLKQTALFSAVALVGAVLTTQLCLPFLMGRYQGKSLLEKRKGYHKVRSIFEKFSAFKGNRWLALILLMITLGGIYRSQWQDDIRHWVAMPKTMLQEMQQIGQLTGFDLGSQSFLITAENDEALLQKEAELTAKLAQEKVDFSALTQWISSQQMQQNFARQLDQKIQLEDYAILVELGIPAEAITQSLQSLVKNTPLTLQEALNTTLGQKWQPYYLGKLAENQVASLVKVKGANSTEMAALANQKDIFWLDKRASLNESFQTTRNHAAWLKVSSFVFAALLLLKWFNGKTTLRLLLIPSAAIVFTLALCGWIGLPIGLFSMFGLLLVSAIGIDYAVYMQTVNEPRFDKQFTLTLAACTTLISFSLLAMSSTPAVAAFGLTVSLGVLFSLLLSIKFIR